MKSEFYNITASRITIEKGPCSEGAEAFSRQIICISRLRTQEESEKDNVISLDEWKETVSKKRISEIEGKETKKRIVGKREKNKAGLIAEWAVSLSVIAVMLALILQIIPA